VRFLIDAQLPPCLASWLVDRGVDAIHVNDLENGLRLPDIELWRIAKVETRIIVTKDMDFIELSAVYGVPPRVVILRYGNCGNDELLNYLREAWAEVKKCINSETVRLILLGRDTIDLYRIQ